MRLLTRVKIGKWLCVVFAVLPREGFLSEFSRICVRRGRVYGRLFACGLLVCHVRLNLNAVRSHDIRVTHPNGPNASCRRFFEVVEFLGKTLRRYRVATPH